MNDQPRGWPPGSAAGHSRQPPSPDEAITSVAATVARASAAIESLRAEIEEAAAWIDGQRSRQVAEDRIERLVEDAERFSDSVKDRAQQQAHRTVAEAEDQARQLIKDAEEDALRIIDAAEAHAAGLVEEARARVTFSSHDATQLRQALEEFTRSNTDLVVELQQLSRLLDGVAPIALAEPHPH